MPAFGRVRQEVVFLYGYCLTVGYDAARVRVINVYHPVDVEIISGKF